MSHTDLHAATEARVTARRQNPDTNKDPKKRGKGSEDNTPNVLRYPYAMLNDSTDYLKIQIARYNPPQQNLGDTLEDVIDRDNPKPILDNKGNKTGAFVLSLIHI